MNLRHCINGHYYDSDGFSACPYCRGEKPENFQDIIPEKYRRLGEISYIGSGSMSRVYKITGQQDYALKVISCGEDHGRYERALSEIRIMKSMHSYVRSIRLLDSEVVAEGNNTWVFLLEEYCTPLVTYLKQKPMRYEQRILLVEELCDALIQCRKIGVMHRDIKPHNLFINTEGRLCLGDFGSARLISEVEEKRYLVGTMKYMAPEVYSVGRYTEQSEIYAVGMVLYQLLRDTKTPRADGEEIREIENRMAGNPLPDLAIEEPELKQIVMDAIHKLCAYDPAERPISFEEVKKILLVLRRHISELAQKNISETIVVLDPVAITVAMTIAQTVHAGFMHWTEQSQAVPDYVEISHHQHFARYEIGIEGRGEAISGGVGHVKLGALSPIPLHAVGGAAPDEMPEWEKTVMQSTEPRTGCRVCGYWLESGAHFCPRCGTQQQIRKPAMEIRNIQISAVAPRKFVKGDYSMVRVMLYEDDYRRIVENLKTDEDQEARTTAQVPDHAQIRVRLTSPDLDIEDDEQESLWTGKFQEFGFAVMLPINYPKRSIQFRALIAVNGVPAARLTFVAKCSSLLEQKLRVVRQDVLSAFISYSSDDRADVIRVIQGMRKARPDMDIFFDVEKLRSGQNWKKALYSEIDQRDLLVLCWSRAAKKSEWVDREWRYALEQKGAECIDPVPLEPAEVCPPPDELDGKHFNDNLLYIRSGALSHWGDDNW